jgi:hypothetical protein
VQTSDPSKIVTALLENDQVDPKALAMQAQLGTDNFEEVMSKFNAHMHDLVKRANASGALSGDETEIVVLKCLLKIAADDFFPGHIRQFKDTYNNLKHFL